VASTVGVSPYGAESLPPRGEIERMSTIDRAEWSPGLQSAETVFILILVGSLA